MRAALLTLALVACAPALSDPAAAQRAADLADATALEHQLAALPAVTSAHVTLHRPANDPLSGAVRVPAGAAILLVAAPPAPASLAADARTLAVAALPEIPSPTIVVAAGAPRAELASVGPFEVTAASRGLLRITLAIALVLVAGLAIAVAYYRRGSSAQ